MTEKDLINFIKSNNYTNDSIKNFCTQYSVSENTLIKSLFKYIVTCQDINNEKKLILDSVNLLSFICKNKVFDEEEIEINRLRIKRARITLLSYLDNHEDITVRQACNNLDEIVLGKSLSVENLKTIIIFMINKKENIDIIKKIINLNKSCIQDNSLFDYVFNIACNSLNNEFEDICYYITLLKILYTSSIDKTHYSQVIKDYEENIYSNEIYNIINGNKRGLKPRDVEIKYSKDSIPLTCPINQSKSTISREANIFTIDGSRCNLKDDALSIKRDGNKYIVGIYVCDVGKYIIPGSILDIQAKNLYKNSYVDDKIIKIIPDIVSNYMSLNRGSSRNVISLYVVLNDSGDLLDYYIKKEYVQISNNLSYINVDDTLDARQRNRLSKSLYALFDLSTALKQKSLEKEKYHEAKSKSKPYNKMYYSDSHMIVGEFSILFNKLLAVIAHEKGFPYIYRAQDESYLPNLIKDNKIALDELSNSVIYKIYLDAYYSTIPKTHHGLHEDYYSQSGSPLRRYPDIYNQYLFHKYYFKDIDFNDSNIERLVDYFNEVERESKLFEEEYNRSLIK